MSNVILYYVVSPVHLRNVALLAPCLAGWELRVAYEKQSPWLTGNSGEGLEMIGFAPGDFPDSLWDGKVAAVVFSAVQPRRGPIALLQAALEKGIPTIAIEESNQMALNQGGINNYVLPVDHVLTASNFERQAMVGQGFPAGRFEVVGWPFYGGRTEKVSEEVRRIRKGELGLDSSRPVAALTLTGLNDAGESPAVRRRQLSLAAQGLPREYQLVIKPHPIEKRETLMPFVEECAPQAKVIEGRVHIENLLEATDVLLNRGASQVCFEALFQQIPVVVLDTGIQTPFHTVAQWVATDGEMLGRIIRELEGVEDWLEAYEPFFREHAPYTPNDARSVACGRIAEIATGERGLQSGKQFFELALYQAWAGQLGAATQLLDLAMVRGADCPREPLLQLINHRAERGDLEVLKSYWGGGFHGHLVRSLWIDQMVSCKTIPSKDDIQWMSDFPSQLQPVWFIDRMRSWAFHLARMGDEATAREFADRVAAEFTHIPGVEQLKREVCMYCHSRFGRMRVDLKNRIAPCLRFLRNRLR
jgi:hypothetical protein